MDVDQLPEKENHQTESEKPEQPLQNKNPPLLTEKPVDERLKDWTKNEIYHLLQGIKAFGSQEISLIAENIRSKSALQIKNAIEYYKERASKQPHIPNRRNIWSTIKKQNSSPRAPLMCWAKLLQDSLSYKDLHTETATALRIIAEFDNIPPATQTEKVDFRNIYHSIANAMEGKAIPENVPLVSILSKCILETALTSKAFIRVGELQNVVECIDMSDKAISMLPRPTDNNELATLRHLASQRTYNPLGIPEQYLKPS